MAAKQRIQEVLDGTERSSQIKTYTCTARMKRKAVYNKKVGDIEEDFWRKKRKKDESIH